MRKIAIACEDNRGMDGEVSAHFGRCPFFLLVDVEDNVIIKSEPIANPHFSNHVPGAVPSFIKEISADVILAGGMGPKAITMFENFGIEVATGAIGNVGNVLAAYLDGKVKGTVPCEHDHGDSCGGH
jgi:predicted Fe-Mo cluster-binding NifX family protein